MMDKSSPCPFCGAAAKVNPLIDDVQIRKPIKLFHRWTLIKERYRYTTLCYTVECSEHCHEFLRTRIIAEDTKKAAIAAWNRGIEPRPPAISGHPMTCKYCGADMAEADYRDDGFLTIWLYACPCGASCTVDEWGGAEWGRPDE